jgi:hypothetical protein
MVRHEKLEPGQIALSSIAYKAEQLKSMPNSPDILVLGSSLPMSAIKYADTLADLPGLLAFEAKAKAVGLNPFQSYCGAKYLESTLAKTSGVKASAFNFTCAACMVSDAYLILKQACAEGKAPKIIFYGIAPRDFVDNLVPEVGTTPSFTVLANATTLPERLTWQTPPNLAFDLVVSSLSQYCRDRSNWKMLCMDWASRIFDHPVNLRDSDNQSANNKSIDSNSQKTDMATGESQLPGLSRNLAAGNSALQEFRMDEDHLRDYRKRYNPANFARLKQETAYFAKLLDLCRQNKIVCVVINMPITDINRTMIPPDIYKKYVTQVLSLPSEYGAEMIDLDSPRDFVQGDFLDSVHTNPRGGKKLLDKLGVALQSSLAANQSGLTNQLGVRLQTK